MNNINLTRDEIELTKTETKYFLYLLGSVLQEDLQGCFQMRMEINKDKATITIDSINKSI